MLRGCTDCGWGHRLPSNFPLKILLSQGMCYTYGKHANDMEPAQHRLPAVSLGSDLQSAAVSDVWSSRNTGSLLPAHRLYLG